MTSLYLHIPFCRSNCAYCAFGTFTGMESLYPRYVQALCRELLEGSRQYGRGPLDTLYIGGGTPTVLGTPLLRRILESCADAYGFKDGAEITIEANPGTVCDTSLLDLRQLGCNRLSLGIQTWDDRELKQLGRHHTAEQGEKAIRAARRAGFAAISLDLMYGIPGQTVGTWQESLQRTLDAVPQHLSLYQLTVEPGTPIERRLAAGSVRLPSERVIERMDAVTEEQCVNRGYEHYEIANWSKPGRACRHNMVYWRNEAYLAGGAGAVSYVDGERARRIADPERYCRAVEAGGTPIDQRERLGRKASFRESVVVGLRLVRGVDGSLLAGRYGLSLQEVYGSVLEDLSERGLVALSGTTLRLTRRGRQFANQVMAQLV